MKIFKSFPIKESLIGLDIGYNSIKFVEIIKQDKFSKLTRFGIAENLPEGILYNQDAQSQTELAEIIKKSLEKAFPTPIKTKKVVTGLPEAKAFTAIIPLPQVEREKIETVIKVEASKVVPFPINKAVIDWQIVSIDDQEKVLLVATPLTLSQSLLGVFEKAELSLIAIETKPIANVRSIVDSDEGIIILDIGANSSSCAICKNQILQYTFTLSIGTETPLPQLINEICQKINEAMNFLKKSKTDIEKIKIAGGGGLIKDINKIEKKIGIKTEIADPLNKIKVAHSLRKNLYVLKNNLPRFSTAIGLALRKEY